MLVYSMEKVMERPILSYIQVGLQMLFMIFI